MDCLSHTLFDTSFLPKMDLDFRVSRKRCSEEGQTRESSTRRRNLNVSRTILSLQQLERDFFHHNEDCTLYRRNLCFICQNPDVVLDKLRTIQPQVTNIEKCQSCGKPVCSDCSHICNGCKRFVCSFCENTMYV